MKKYEKFLLMTIPVTLALGASVFAEDVITLSDSEILVNGASVEGSEAVQVSNDIIYYEDRDTYESGNVYGEGKDADKHSAEEAAAHTVVTITAPGTYRLTGDLSAGQIAVDLGEDAKTDPEAVVTLIFDNANITCSVAPAVIFYRVYECDEAWVAYDEGETENYEASAVTDLSAAGARVIVADGSTNDIHGSYVAKIYKDSEEQKKKCKYDGAFYSKMSMSINGETQGDGVLNITADNEGLDSELHLTIDGGVVNIMSQDDGINTNEDNVSVTTINGGTIHILGGLGAEGDGVDSNGYLVINGGVVVAAASPFSDSGLDSDCGSYINGGYVIATGSTMDWPESESNQVTINLQFAQMQDATEAIVIKDQDGNVVLGYDPNADTAVGSLKRDYQGTVISCPEFQVGATYQIYIGDILQGYSGTQVGFNFGFGGGRPGGFDPNGGEAPEGFDPGNFDPNSGEAPEGFDPGNFDPNSKEAPEGFNPGNFDPNSKEAPEGFGPGNGQGRPDGNGQGRPGGDGQGKPEGFNPGNFGSGTDENAEVSTEFVMTDKVNSFSSVADYKE